MKVARLVKPGLFQFSEEPVPEPGAGEVLIRSEAVGICASDIHYFEDGGIGENRLTAPLILGHEPMGTIVAVGPDVPGERVGQRVAVEPGIPCFRCELCLRGDVNLCPHVRFFGSPPVDGALREHFVHPASLVEEVPEDFSPELGALLEPLGVAIHAVDLARPKLGTSAVVIGCGPIGISTILMLGASGVSPIVGVDPLKYRTEAARTAGADSVFVGKASECLEKVLETTGGRGFDAVFEAAGHPSAQGPSVEYACIGGKVVVIGISAEDRFRFRESHARRKGLTLYMARRSRFTLQRGIRLIETGRVDPSPLLTHRFSFDRVQEAFETVSGYKDGVLKAVVTPCGG